MLTEPLPTDLWTFVKSCDVSLTVNPLKEGIKKSYDFGSKLKMKIKATKNGEKRQIIISLWSVLNFLPPNISFHLLFTFGSNLQSTWSSFVQWSCTPQREMLGGCESLLSSHIDFLFGSWSESPPQKTKKTKDSHVCLCRQEQRAAHACREAS